MTEILDWLKTDGAISLITVFIITQIINVIVATFKNVVTIKGNRLSAAFLNGLSYAVNALVIKKITGISNEVILIFLTFITNFLGVYISLYVMYRFKKDKLWIITSVVSENESESFEIDIADNNIRFSKLNYTGNTRAYMLFSKNKEESDTINRIFKKYNNIQYTITTNTWEFR